LQDDPAIVLERGNKVMQTLRVTIGGLLALALSGISIACCYIFGTHLAPGHEGQLYGILGGTADALKAILPLGIGAALAARQRGRAATGAALFAVFSIYSFASELGLYALSRDAQATSTTAGQEQYRLLKDERARIGERLKALGQPRPTGAIKADIAARHQDRLWTTTSECKEAAASASRAFCAGLDKLAGELAGAEESEQLRARDGELAAKQAGVNLADALKSADPQSEALARLTGFTPPKIKDALAILIAVLIELGSGLGLYAVTAAGAGPTDSKGKSGRDSGQGKRPLNGLTNGSGRRSSSKRRDPVKAFVKDRTVKGEEQEAKAGDLHSAFIEWAAAQNADTLSSKAFGARLTKLGFTREKRGGVIRYKGLALPLLN
jgi:hypothetical protein